MAKLVGFRRLLIVVTFLLFISAVIVDGLTSLPTRAICHGSIAECSINIEDDGFMSSAESNNRRTILQMTRSYISYGALQANNVPCSRQGSSYYNCQAGAQANPYTRSCTVSHVAALELIFLFPDFYCLNSSLFGFCKIDFNN